MTARPLIASGSTVSSVPPDWFNVLDYGAIGNSDGTSAGSGTDDTAAFQAAINAAKAANGTVYVPAPHNYRITDTLACTGHSWRFTGSGSGGAGPTLFFDLPDNRAGLAYHSTYHFELDHLRVVPKTGYSGKLVDVDGLGSLGTGGDCQDWSIHHMSLTGDAAAGTKLIHLNKVHTGWIHDCDMGGCANHIYAGTSQFVNCLTIGPNNIFNPSCTDKSIVFSNGGFHEKVRIENNTFEAGINTGALKCINGAEFFGLVYAGNWHGDSSGNTIWLESLANGSANHVGLIMGNQFQAPSATPCMKLGPGDWTIIGNDVYDAWNVYDFYSAGTTKVLAIGNSYQNVQSAVLSASGEPATYVKLRNLGDTDQMVSAFSTSRSNNAGAVSEGFYVGYIPFFPGTTGGVGMEGGGANPVSATLLGLNEARLRVSGGAANGEVRAQANKLGFYGTAPVARSAAYTLNAGSTSRNLPAGSTTLDVEKALRQLITDLQANGLLQ